MIRDYARFAATNWPKLLFGAMLMGLSSFGQTYFVSLFGGAFRHTFDLTDGGLGTTYAIGTFASAMTLGWAGRLIDYTSVRRFTWVVTAILAGACLVTAFAPSVIVLAIGFYFLRLGGQGLMTHTALTTTARAFPIDTGKALSIVILGMSVAQAFFPLAGVTLLDHLGWRTTWIVNAGVLVVGIAIALCFLPRAGDVPLLKRGAPKEAGDALAIPLWKDKRLYYTLPCVLASPFIVTGFFFHQARLAQEKGWPLSWLAGWLIGFAVVQAFANLAIGPIIDRYGPRRVLSVFLIPQTLAMLVLFATDSLWTAPAYLMLSAMSAAVASTLVTALWVELYGAKQLARVRSAVESGNVLASGASPIVMGVLIDHGVSLSIQALACAVYTVVASLLALKVRTMQAPAFEQL